MSDPLDRLAADADRLAGERRRVPGSTYRLQMHARVHLAGRRPRSRRTCNPSASPTPTRPPLLAAKPGSTHGYDVIDHGRLNPEIGTDDEFAPGSPTCDGAAWGWSSTRCPNHMCVGGPNAWWDDVLEHGPARPFAGYFDIAWNDHPRERLHGKVLLPILGQPYGAEIEAGRVPRRVRRRGLRHPVRRAAAAGRPADLRGCPGAGPGGGPRGTAARTIRGRRSNCRAS